MTPRPSAGIRLAAMAAVVWAALLAESFLAARHPQGVERAYSQATYPLVARSLAAVSGLVPFAITEVALFA